MNIKTIKIGILNGPNLNRLGKREPEIYGSETLSDIEQIVRNETNSILNEKKNEFSISLDFFQSNVEGELINKIYEWADSGFNGIIINPGAFAHTSVALRDCISGSQISCVEVHISNIYKREEFRHQSLTAPVCLGVISGLGIFGYSTALRYLLLK